VLDGGEKAMMKRMDITVSEVHIKRLKAMQKKLGISASDLIRRALDEYWDKLQRKSERG
jgi:hypothetical protein